MTALRFPLAEVLELAEHAITAPTHGDPVADETTGPALLLVADDGVYLLSSGEPQLPPGPDQPATSGVRAVYADGLRPGTPWTALARALGSDDDLLTAIPLREPADNPLIDQLRHASGHHDTLTLTITGDEALITSSRTRAHAASD